MIAIPKQKKSQKSVPEWQTKFVNELLPSIIAHARFSFRDLPPEAREEQIQAVVCHCCAAVARLAELGKLDLAYPYALARYAVVQVKEGRMTGGRLNCKDISSEYCRRRKNVVLERLDKFDEVEQKWEDALVADKTCTPADLAASRIDISFWFATLKPRIRRVAQFLSLGHRTSDAAQKFCMSRCRISQLRRELHESWQNFCGETQATET